MKKFIKYFCLISLCSVLVIFVTACGNSYLSMEESDISHMPEESYRNSDDNLTQKNDTDLKQNAADIYVHISGAVVRPGVYVLAKGSRVFELIEKAGGLTLDADDIDINQAAELSDGQRIHVFCEGERIASNAYEPSLKAETAADGCVNINTADSSTLCSLPGIGNTRADAIIAYRTKNGRFNSIEDIMGVPGIKDNIFSQIKDKIKV